MNSKQIKYMSKYMLDINDWDPDLDQNVLDTLDICQSKLEILYFLGALYSMYKKGYSNPLVLAKTIFNYPALLIYEVFAYCPDGNGPGSMAFIPQYKVGKITADYGIAFNGDNGGRIDHFMKPEVVIEIEGYGIHKSRRQKDDWRKNYYLSNGYKVYQLCEELQSPTTWFNDFIQQRIEKEINESINKQINVSIDTKNFVEHIEFNDEKYYLSCGLEIIEKSMLVADPFVDTLVIKLDDCGDSTRNVLRIRLLYKMIESYPGKSRYQIILNNKYIRSGLNIDINPELMFKIANNQKFKFLYYINFNT